MKKRMTTVKTNKKKPELTRYEKMAIFEDQPYREFQRKIVGAKSKPLKPGEHKETSDGVTYRVDKNGAYRKILKGK